MLVPGRVPDSRGYLGREVFMAVSGRPRRNDRKSLYGTNDSVSSGTSNVINNWGSGTKPWTCRQHCASLV